MRYDPVNNAYYKWISEDTNDLRALFYTPVEDSLILVNLSIMGDCNKTLLSEHDWDRIICTHKTQEVIIIIF